MISAESLLVRHPQPETNESLLAYVLRLTEVNGYSSPLELMRFTGAKGRELTVRRMNLRGLSRATQCPIDKLRRINLRSSRKRSYGLGCLNGISLPLSEIHLRRSKVCTQCVKELPYIQAHWHLDLMIACPIHGRKATTECPLCGCELQWLRRGLLVCHCGADVSDHRTESLNPSILPILHLLRSRALQIQVAKEEPCLSDELYALSLPALITIIRVVGGAQLASLGQKQENCEELLVASTDVLTDWPHRFYLLLKRLGDAGNTGRSWEAKSYRSLLIALFTRPPRKVSRELQFVKRAMISYMAEQDGHGQLDAKLKKEIVWRSSSSHLSRSDLARQLRKGPNVIDRILRANNIPVERRCNLGKPKVVIRACELDKLEDARLGILSTRAASLRLGLSEATVCRLMRMGFGRGNLHKWTKHGILAADIEAFEQRIRRVKQTAWSLPEYYKLNMRWILARQRLSDEELVEFFKRLQDSSISIVGSSDSTIGGLLIHRLHLEEFRSSFGLCDRVSVLGTAQVLRCDRNAILGLLQEGYLQAVTTHPALMINSSSLRAFSTNYRSVAEIAVELKTSARKVISICDGAAIPLLTVKHSTRSPQSFLRRSSEAQLKATTRRSG